MTTNTTSEVVGCALYIEARRFERGTHYTTQLLIVPEAATSTDSVVNMSAYRRRISTVEPRKTWRHFSSPTNAKRIHETKGLPASSSDVSTASVMLGFLRHTLTGLTDVNNGYTIVGQPIVVEVTTADLADVRLGKTPYKIFGRVWKCRKKLGFPETFLAI